MLGWKEIIFRLIIASLVGGAIGIEREYRNRPAGLRTHVLVSLGAALIMLISIDGFSNLENTGDPARLASQVVSGIGFLGAGTILRTENKVAGLTTAASLWLAAGIGLATGAGYYIGTITTSVIAMITLMKLDSLNKRLGVKDHIAIGIVAKDRPGIIGEVGCIMGKHKLLIKDISVKDHFDNKVSVKFFVKTSPDFNLSDFSKEIHDIEDINKLYYNE